ncbi:hypothetical protein Tco_1038841, partial [Tanacetum coccineum]
GIMPTKVELTPEQSQHGDSDDVLVGPHGTRGTNVSVATPFQQSRIHYHVLVLKLQKSYIQLKCNKNVIGQKAQVHVKIGNSDNHELPHHQRSSKSNQESSSGEIVNQRNIK